MTRVQIVTNQLFFLQPQSERNNNDASITSPDEINVESQMGQSTDRLVSILITNTDSHGPKFIRHVAANRFLMDTI